MWNIERGLYVPYLVGRTNTNVVLLHLTQGGQRSPFTHVISFLQHVHLYMPDCCTVYPVVIVFAIYVPPY